MILAKHYYLIFSFSLIITGTVSSQSITKRLQLVYQSFESDTQLKSAIASLYVIDGKTGKVVFDKNSTMGLAPASTQKIFTATAAYELLGKDFRYTTEFGYSGSIGNNNLNGSLYIKGSGDPTLGSWRWKSTSEDSVINRIVKAVQLLNISNYRTIILDTAKWGGEKIPDGWIWQDIGNYYGAGAGVLNWRENQYDLVLRSGKNIGDKVNVVSVIPRLYSYSLVSAAVAAAKGSGDNSYIYFPVTGFQGMVRGTIPVGEDHFIVSGAMPSAENQFIMTLSDSLSKLNILQKTGTVTVSMNDQDKITIIHREQSPQLDSIIYWFLKRSINLYGEALAKTIANRQSTVASTDNGVKLIKEFWNSKEIPLTEVNIVDGSGLSPLNRVTTHAQVSVLQYAKAQPWFNGFYYALPEYNGMKMKSGTISDVKGFCGYHTSKDGNEYIFSFLVNNYNGTSSSLIQKMYKVLDVLK
jgi:D-alanyl-D-alanine carboxypeptidase/D-alanyl-D-alanine-endopeptidase (penicillin-binding protein 4)